MNDFTIHNLKQIDRYRWLLPKQGKMRTDGLLFLDRSLLEHIKNDKSITQVANVACLLFHPEGLDMTLTAVSVSYALLLKRKR